MTQSRRSFLKNAAFLPSAIYLTQCKTVGRAGASGSYLKTSPVNDYIPKRVSWDDFPKPDKEAFIKAVSDMREKKINVPATFGRGGARTLDLWTAQAEIHQWYCPHGTRDFLPWHRAYLYHFELILRKLTGNDNFRLPYWDWSKSQDVPSEFMDETFLKSLDVDLTDRFGTIAFPTDPNDPEGLKPGDEGTAIWWRDAMLALSTKGRFEDIGGDINSNGGIEHPYHNMVHTGVGGSMSYVALAARDPVFWLHHCNVDRLWAAWMDSRIIAMPDPNVIIDPQTERTAVSALFPDDDDVNVWLDRPFNKHFLTVDGDAASATVRSSLFTEKMGYNYGGIKNNWTISDIPLPKAKKEEKAAVEAVSTTSPGLRLADPAQSVLSLQFTLPAALYDSAQKLSSLRLKVGGIPVPADTKQIYDVQLVIQGRTLALNPIAFFDGTHAGHEGNLIGISLNDHLDALKALPEGKRTVKLILILKNRRGKALPIPGLNTNPGAYQVNVKAIFQ